MAIVTPPLTPQDALEMFNRGELDPELPWELVDGKTVWLPRSKSRESETCVRILAAMYSFAQSIGARMFDSSGGFTVGADRQQLRSPDVSLVVSERQHLIDADGWVAGAPDLAVEVLSRGEYGEAYARRKVPEYIAAGAKVVWLVNPRRRTVREYLAQHAEARTYTESDTVRLDAIAPGFSARVGDFFPQ